jgi:hypothetical protein
MVKTGWAWEENERIERLHSRLLMIEEKDRMDVRRFDVWSRVNA